MYGQPEIGKDDKNLKDTNATANKDYEVKDTEKTDYCEIGMDYCVSCGWRGTYPVSGCPRCHESFCS